MSGRGRQETDRLTVRWRCGDGIALSEGPDGALKLTLPARPPVSIGMPPAMRRLALRLNAGLSDRDIGAEAGADVGLAARAFALVSQLRRNGLLVADLCLGARLLATIRPLVADFSLDRAPPPDGPGPWRLSRFSLLRSESSHWTLENSEASCDVAIRDARVLTWLHDAAAPEPEPGRMPFLQCLARLGFLESADAAESPARRTWEFHDRLFHARTRAFAGLRPFGDTYRFRDRAGSVPCPPTEPPPYDGETVGLSVPDPGPHGSLAGVMERRRSRRDMGVPPVALEQIAALLYRVARTVDTDSNGLIRRPYPSGGALHELEFYLAVRECAGLARGFYHYRGGAHLLTRVSGDAADESAASMIDDCALAWTRPGEPPQCLIVIASRLPRLAWKYEAIAYRISLMNAGVALQSLSLAATDLGLNASIAGSGNPTLFARATGKSDWEETSIAEFGFGSRPGESPG